MSAAELHPRPVVGRPLPWSFPAVRESVRPNGLTVLVVDLPGAALPTAQLLLDLPVRVDPPGREGASVLAAQCLDEGTTERDAEGFADALESLGASFYASGGTDGTRMAVQAPARHLRGAMSLFAEAVISPVFPAGEVERLVASRLDAIAQERANPGTRARQAFREVAYAPGERARIADGGSRESVSGIDRDLVAELYLARSHPRLATLVLAGDFGADGAGDPDELAAAFDGWGAGREPGAPSDVGAVGTVEGPRVVVVDKPGAVQTELLLGRPGLDRTHPQWSAASAVGWALGGTLTSRIDALLREEKGFTYGMRAGLQPRRVGGVFSVHGSVDTPSTAEAVADLLGVLRTAARDGFTEAERLSTADYLAGVAPLNYETPEALAGHVLMLRGAGLPDRWLDGHLQRLRDLTVEQMNAAAAAHTAPDGAVLVAVGDASVIAGPLGDVGLGPVETVPL